MKYLLHTAEHCIKSMAYPACLKNLPAVISKHTDWEYSWEPTDTGYLLKPTFCNMPYRNSFVPEIDITVSHYGSQTFLYMQGQPVKPIRIFMVVWFGIGLMMETLVLFLAITSRLDNAFLVFLPVIMCAFFYFICRIFTGATFKSVVKAIQKELK